MWSKLMTLMWMTMEIVLKVGKFQKINSQSYFSQNRKAAFGELCPKSIWDKSQFYVPMNQTSEKIMALFMSIWILKSWILGAFFSDFLLVGTYNWDLSQILFGQELIKAAIVKRTQLWNWTKQMQFKNSGSIMM